MERRAVIIEDERDVSRLVEFNLRGAGFEVTRADTARDGLTAVRDLEPLVVVLDVMLPDGSGFDVCREIRSAGATVGIMMLTVLAEPEQLRQGFDAGADDYCIKPFVVRELVNRVEVLATLVTERRAAEPASHRELRLVAHRLLSVLLASPERVFSREDLFEQVWGRRDDGDARTIDVHLRRLGADLVERVQDRGYRAKRVG